MRPTTASGNKKRRSGEEAGPTNLTKAPRDYTAYSEEALKFKHNQRKSRENAPNVTSLHTEGNLS